MEQKLKQQLNMLNRLYKESDEIYSCVASGFGLPDTTFWILYAIGDCTQNDFVVNGSIPFKQ